MREIGERADPEEMMRALRRYEDGYATYEGTEAYRSAKPAWAALRGEWYALHEAGLAGTRTSGGASPTSSLPLTLSREERAEQIWEEVAAQSTASRPTRVWKCPPMQQQRPRTDRADGLTV